MAKVMAVNCGSSSLKFKLYEMPEEKVITSGIVERIGHKDAIFTIKIDDEKVTKILEVQDHGVAVQLVMDALIEHKIISSYDEIKATGHRVVQGGPYFRHSALFNDDTYSKIESLIPLAPLHNKSHLVGYDAFKKVLPHTPAVAVFDTAFHQTMLPEDYMYPIKKEYSEKYMIRRYGAHGTSHKYLCQLGETYLDGDDKRMIICHLGSGASITATHNGRCVATSMGLTPDGGIMMNTRTGDMDPSVYYQVLKMSGKDNETIFQEFNKQSGLYGVSGISNDSRDVEDAAEAGDKDALLAVNLWARRVADFIGQYYVRLGRVDMIIFSAGIGENAGIMRKYVLERIKEALGIVYDEELNMKVRGTIATLSTKESKVKVMVIPTDEELMIARETIKTLKKNNID